MGFIDRVRGWFGSEVKAEITTSKELEAVLVEHGNQSFTGVSVTPEVAMMVSAVSSVTSLLAETTAQLPFPVYRRLAGGGKEREPNNPVAKLLNTRPNGFQNAFEFRELMMMHLLLWGNCYAFINRFVTGPKRGQISELLPIHPDRVKVSQAEDYAITYTVSLPGGDRVRLPQDRVFHIRDRSFNGYEGVSRLKSGRDSIGLARVAERWGAQLFGNGARPSGILTTEQKLNEEQMRRLKQSWQSAHGGENALGTAVLDGGFNWTPTALNMKDAQFIEARKFQLNEVARIYRAPPHMIGDLERSTNNNIEHQGMEFVKYHFMPWLRRWDMAVNTQLLDPEKGLFAEFLVEGLLRGDTKTRYDAHASALQNEWMTKNEVRARENLNPVEGGDEFRNPAINPQDSGEGNEPAQSARD